MIRLTLPQPLRTLASIHGEVQVTVEGPATMEAVLDALEVQYPVLRGTLRDQFTKQRRPFIRFFAIGQDLSLNSPSLPLPEAVATGAEPLRIVAAMAGG